MGEEPQVRELPDADATGEGHSGGDDDLAALAAVFPAIIVLWTASWAIVIALCFVFGYNLLMRPDVNVIEQTTAVSLIVTGIATSLRLLRFTIRV